MTIIDQLKSAYAENPAKALNLLPELFQAEEDGLIIELPCKVGGTVWTNFSVSGDYLKAKDRPYACEVVFVGINDGDCFMNVQYKNGRMYQFFFSAIGKIVFLTRAEAEQSLKEREKK